ncbi:TonB-dependent receptor [Sphingomonas trueperi]|uniref:TonB-dependent receptor n=1 Tax=Sphingomonas trueperi TaxID=53317 RepID=UPI003394902D
MISRFSSIHASSLTAALRAGASLATLSLLGLSSTALAQTAAAAPQGSEAATQDTTAADGAQEIVVTGIRASLQSARNRKRDAEQVVDSITAQDIGALPDRSVSEALQRVPGVTLQRTNENRDPARLSSEGGGVFIRGLSWVRSELNGRDVFSANNGRGLSFEDVSSDLLVGVDVYKNPSAELIEGGIGGIVNLRTRKPFDAPGYVFALSGDANYADLRKKTFWSGNALASGRWQTPLGEMGLLLSYSINNIGNRTDSITAGRYDRGTLTAPQDGLAAGTNVYIPAGMGFRRIDWQQKRTAFDGSFQWKPSDTLQLTFEAVISKATPHDIEYAVGDYDTPSSDNSSYKFGPNNELQSGTITNRNLNLDTRAGSQDKKTQDFSGNLRWTPNENWAVSADLQYIKSTAKVYSMTAFTGASIPTTIAFDFSGDDPKMTFTPTNSAQSLTNKNDYWWAAAMDHIENNEAHEWATRADVEYTFTDSEFLKSFRVGGRFTDRNATTRQSTYNWAMLSAQYWSLGSPVFLNQTGRAGGPQSAGLPGQTSLINYNNFFRGKVPQPGAGFWFPAASLVQSGTASAYNYLKNTEMLDANGQPSGWKPLSDDYSTTPGGINNQIERTYAGYALLRFGMDQSPIGKFDGNIGVRVIRTENEATGTPISIAAPTSSPTLCVVGTPIATGPRAGQTVNATDCANYAAAFKFAGGTITQATAGSGSYTDVLPSLNLRFFLKDNLQLRFAAAKAIVRPTFMQLNPYVQLGFNFDSVTGIATGVGSNGRLTGFTGSAGNPNLKPTRSNQFDLSLEYYFGRSNSITLAGFYKDISNYIFAGATQQTFTSNGQTLTFDVTQQTNGSKGKIKGFELGYTQFFDMLPGALGGLGFSGNFTFVDSSGGKNTAVNVFDSNQTTNAGLSLPLEGLSKTSYNAALVYEKYGVSARAAYNWRSHYLLTTSAANLNYPVWSESYGQLDASILYSLNKHIKIGVQGYNLLNSRTFLDVGDPNLKPRYSWTDTDRRFAFLFRSVF